MVIPVWIRSPVGRAVGPASPRRRGVATQREFSRLAARLIGLRVRVSLVDHTMSKAICLWDPNGLGIKIALETSERFSRFGPMQTDFSVVDSEGRLRSGRDPLDLSVDLGHLGNADPRRPLADGSHVAHLHLHVPDLTTAIAFYERIGFARNLYLPQLGFADLGAGGAYTHRIAINTWQGESILPTPDSCARLAGYSLRARDPEILDVARRLPTAIREAQDLRFVDPSGATLVLT